jgi:glycosyltransferase involved in cell wall biosynthesis
MIRIFVNGLASSAGGGLTYLRNITPWLARRNDVAATILIGSSANGLLASAENVSIIERTMAGNAARRFVLEQRELSEMIHDCGAQVLISAGNFALRKSPVPQILLSRNALYTSADFLRDLRNRGDYALLLDTQIKSWLAKKSISWADYTVAPSEAFAKDLHEWAGENIAHIHHGFDAEAFNANSAPLPKNVQSALASDPGALRLLFVSHYNYYRNFETLFRALPLLKSQLGGRKVKLYLTCRLNSEENPGSYKAEKAAALLGRLGISEDVVQLGAVAYSQLHHLYRACDLYVTPAYAETFAHPLVEAMACGVPIIASDLAVHKEVCKDAALYFPRFSPDVLAERVLQVAQTPDLTKKLSTQGQERVKAFSWEKHVDQLLALASKLVKSKAA